MNLMEIVQEIIKGYEYETVIFRRPFGLKKQVKFKLKEQYLEKLFFPLFEKGRNLLGNPVFIHSHYGYIWEKSGRYLALHCYEEYYQDEILEILFFDRLPAGKKIKYADYMQVVEMVRQMFADHDINCNPSVCYYAYNAFLFWGENKNIQCLLTVKRKTLTFSCNQKERMNNGMGKLLPHSACKQKLDLRTPETIKYALQNCFDDILFENTSDSLL